MNSSTANKPAKKWQALALCATVGLIGMTATVPTFAAGKASFVPKAAATASKAAGYLAVVNGTSISREAFLSRLEATYGTDMLTEIITEDLIDQAATAHKVVIADADLKAACDRSRAQFKTQSDFDGTLAKYHLTVAGWRHQIWMSMVLAKLGAPAAPTDAQLKALYEKDTTKYDQPEQVDVRHILVKTEAEGKTVLDKLAKGGDFTKLAEQYSIDTISKVKGGDIGYVHKGQLVPEFETAAFALKAGETSGLVKTVYGYHIIRLIDHKMAKKADFDSAKAAVLKDWTTANTTQPKDVVAKLRAASTIQIGLDTYKSLAQNPTAAPAASSSAKK